MVIIRTKLIEIGEYFILVQEIHSVFVGACVLSNGQDECEELTVKLKESGFLIMVNSIIKFYC